MVKPSDKSKSNVKIRLVEDNKLISQDKDNVELPKYFFPNAIENLKITAFINANPLREKCPNPEYFWFVFFHIRTECGP